MSTHRFREHSALVGLLLVMGCGASAPVSRKASRQYVPAEIQPGPGESVISKSTPDKRNRYAAAVLVEGGHGTCSGVLAAPRTVLTAGHCVCKQRAAKPGTREGGAVIDKTTCVQTALVKVVTYQPKQGPTIQRIPGSVNPHEELLIVYDDEEKELSSTADIAVIALREAPQGVTPIQLATEPVRYTQPVTLVGYGRDIPEGGIEGIRRFGSNEVASIAESGATFLVGKPIQIQRPYKPKELLLVREESSYSLKGDSGGPCLRERKGILELVGLAKTHYGGHALVQFSEYTSTYFYLEWLQQQISRSERKGSD